MKVDIQKGKNMKSLYGNYHPYNFAIGQEICYQTKKQRRIGGKPHRGVITRIRIEIDGETIISPRDIKRCSL